MANNMVRSVKKNLTVTYVDWAGTSDDLVKQTAKYGLWVRDTGKSLAGGHPLIEVMGTSLSVTNFLAEYNSNQ